MRLLLLGGLLFQSGCIGVSVVAGTYRHEVGKSIGPRVGKIGQSKDTTATDALRQWGEPRRKKTVGTQEHWTYKTNELTWRGLEVWGIIAVPLIVPVGKKKVNLAFENGRLVGYTKTGAREWFYGLFLNQTDRRLLRFNEEIGEINCVGYWGCY